MVCKIKRIGRFVLTVITVQNHLKTELQGAGRFLCCGLQVILQVKVRVRICAEDRSVIAALDNFMDDFHMAAVDNDHITAALGRDHGSLEFRTHTPCPALAAGGMLCHFHQNTAGSEDPRA